MLSVDVKNQEGAKVSTIELAEEIFAIEPNMQVVFDVVYAQRAGMRQGTAKAKNRNEVRGGGRKPWRQKGTGKARQGSIRAPQWVGGGVVFGPNPRKYTKKVNKKVASIAVKSLLSDRFANDNMIIIDKIELQEQKTKNFANVLMNLNVHQNKTIVVLAQDDYDLFLVSRNIPGVYVQTLSHLSVYDLINAEKYVLTTAAVEKYQEVLK
ncbi:MAG: 50S ribosomal protein L4 [Bacilli bacterium]|jgi:large subunit ribosomal protein L4|nr:50S ribosomal protein L4 [Bacilli bacterium]MDD2681645.1 50S ribosomal protein L4 [Bacilli bacterium]MDD3120960.1 50S ribosomal protein L4 [Bacilli bacterium]MDD4063134.1 50S ribosomal protein L4 [Bacilli bacterium]MDD4481774.1 50S ribosomal protein L4 [Bacilli bacterium]